MQRGVHHIPGSASQGNTRLYWVPPLMQWAKLPRRGKCILEGRKVLHERWLTHSDCRSEPWQCHGDVEQGLAILDRNPLLNASTLPAFGRWGGSHFPVVPPIVVVFVFQPSWSPGMRAAWPKSVVAVAPVAHGFRPANLQLSHKLHTGGCPASHAFRPTINGASHLVEACRSGSSAAHVAASQGCGKSSSKARAGRSGFPHCFPTAGMLFASTADALQLCRCSQTKPQPCAFCLSTPAGPAPEVRPSAAGIAQPAPAAVARPPVTAAAAPTAAPVPAAGRAGASQPAAAAVQAASLPAALAAAPEAAAAGPEAAAAEQEEGESLAPFRPASAESPRGRLATALAVTSPYMPAQRQAGIFQEAAEAAGGAAGRKEEPAAGAAGRQPPAATAGLAAAGGEPSLDRWALAAEQPVAAVGGVSGDTHIGGAAALAAAHMQAAPGAVAEAGEAGEAREAAPPARSAAVEQPTAAAAAAAEEEEEEGEQEWQLLPQPERERPLSREDVRAGQGLAAADMAAGHHAAVDAAAVAAPLQAAGSGGAEAAGEAGPAARAAAHEAAAAEAPARELAAAQFGGPQAASVAAAEGQVEQPGYTMGPAPAERRQPSAAAAEGGPAEQPLLPAGGFNREQDISVFRPVLLAVLIVCMGIPLVLSGWEASTGSRTCQCSVAAVPVWGCV